MKSFFVIGNPIQHSLSPLVHNFWFKKYQLNFAYDKLEVHEKDLLSIINKVRSEEILGINVTIPFKQKIIPFLDILSDTAKVTNSVNTIYKKSDKIVGANTDVFGFEQSLKKLSPKKSIKNALIIGSGGVTPSIVFALKNLGLDQITLTNRTMEKAELLKTKFSPIVNLLSWKNLKDYKNADIVINATSLGLPGSNLDIDFYNLNKKAIIYDIIYNPKKTKFLKLAKQKGHIIANGMSMFLYQAQKSFEIWTKIKPSIDEELIKKINNKLYD